MKQENAAGSMDNSGGFSWNVVARGCEPGPEIFTELRQRIVRLAALLERFPPNQVHLMVSLASAEPGPRYETKLDLKLPLTILHAQDKGKDQYETVRHSFFVLERQLEKLVAGLRGERRWRRDQAPGGARPPAFGEPMQKGPQTKGDLLRNFIFRHFNRLLLHATRRVADLEAEGEIPAGTIDPQEVLDEATRVCLEDPERKPPELTYELWLYRLIGEEADREYRHWLTASRKRVDLPESGPSPLDELQDSVAREMEAEDALAEEQFIDPTTPSPDLLLEESDLVAEVLRQVRRWEKRDRDIFNLHFLDGFDAVETAMVEKMEVSEVEKAIDRLRLRLRKILREAGQ